MAETKPCPTCGAPVDACDELVAAHDDAIAERDRRIAWFQRQTDLLVEQLEGRWRIRAWRRAKAERDSIAELESIRQRAERAERIAEAAIKAWRRAKAERDEARRSVCALTTDLLAEHSEADPRDIAVETWGTAVAQTLFPEDDLC